MSTNLVSVMPEAEPEHEYTTGGEDTLVVAWYVELSEQATSELARRFDAAMRIAQMDKPPEDTPPTVAVGDHVYRMMPQGFNPGKNRYSSFPYHMIDGGIHLGFSPRKITEKSSTPNLRMEVKSVPFLEGGNLRHLWPGLVDRVRAFGGRILKNRLSRVDACVDLANVAVRSLQETYDAGRFVSRARAGSHHGVLLSEDNDEVRLDARTNGRRQTGFTLGRGDIILRIYDKAHECRHDEVKTELLRTRRWGCIPAQSLRAEFQLRREALRGMTIIGKKDQIETVEDWLDCRAVILDYLKSRWITFYGDAFDPRHTEALTDDLIHPDWRKVRDAFTAWCGEPVGTLSRTERGIRIESEKLVKQAIGCMQTAFIRGGIWFSRKEPDWPERFLRLCASAFKRFLEPDEFFRKQNQKEMRRYVEVPECPIESFLSPPESTGVGVTHGHPECTPEYIS
jgi:hypothetical protein